MVAKLHFVMLITDHENDENEERENSNVIRRHQHYSNGTIHPLTEIVEMFRSFSCIGFYYLFNLYSVFKLSFVCTVHISNGK